MFYLRVESIEIEIILRRRNGILFDKKASEAQTVSTQSQELALDSRKSTVEIKMGKL